jgi:hypothetical protein
MCFSRLCVEKIFHTTVTRISSVAFLPVLKNFYQISIMNVSEAIFSANLKWLEDNLKTNHSLASEEIPLPDNPAKAHPLHRISDGVCDGGYSEDTAIEMAKKFFEIRC